MKIQLTNRQRNFLQTVYDKQIEPYNEYRGFIKLILKQDHYFENSKKELNKLGYRYMKKYFTTASVMYNGDDTYYKDLR
jgi:hypothetical protein